MKKTIIKSFIWVMDAMVDGLCPWVRKSMEDRKPILLTADPAQTGDHTVRQYLETGIGAGAYAVTIPSPHLGCLTFTPMDNQELSATKKDWRTLDHDYISNI